MKKSKLIIIALLLTIIIVIIIITTLPTKLRELPLAEIKAIVKGDIKACEAANKNLICLAITNNDISYCRNDLACTETYKLMSAIKSNNIDKCEQIVIDNVKVLCKAFFIRNADVCSLPFQNFMGDKATCQAFATQNISYCLNSQEKAACQDLVYLFTSIKENKAINCENIASDEDRAFCKSIILGSDKICHSTVYKFCNDVEYQKAAIIYKNEKLCNEIINKTIKQKCFENLKE
ncbi:hypothetical protein DRJ17_01965 [Candidatus Woesearchaeota archaeon]|nr:MAG: hypothetical protein DRJ17_01965 [Candidatus Woesearchaeota archaeon]